MKVKVKKLSPDAVLPYKGSAKAIGYDIVATDVVEKEGSGFGYIEYRTGLAVEPEEGYYVELYPRSSLSDTGLIMGNSVGVIDPDFRGELRFRFKYVQHSRKYEVGDRIGQMVVRKDIPSELELVEELSDSERSDQGFGSTGK